MADEVFDGTDMIRQLFEARGSLTRRDALPHDVKCLVRWLASLVIQSLDQQLPLINGQRYLRHGSTSRIAVTRLQNRERP